MTLDEGEGGGVGKTPHQVRYEKSLQLNNVIINLAENSNVVQIL